GGLAVSKYFDDKVGEECSGTEDVTPQVNFTATLGEVTMNSAEFILNGMDESNKVIFQAEYNANIEPISIDDGEEGKLIINGLNSETDYSFSITASDLAGNHAVNGPIVFDVKTLVSTNTPCNGNDFISQLGEFEIGYNYSFETDGTDVIMTFELLDNKEGVFAFLWKETPFTESRLDNVSGKIYSARITDQEVGSTIRYACKFEFQGGLAVTKYFSYVVGENCGVLNTSDFKSEIKVYPNPIVDQLSIDGVDVQSVSVFNLNGMRIMNSRKSTLSFSEMNPGTYLILVVGNNGKESSFKVVKE
ncbi:MAG: T9SS type A sorting domain-containing protein, partial [Ekhidna sp.]